jgi:hypothetical protein
MPSAALVGLKFRALAFCGAFLMFTAELMVARALLPSFGSSASVWTTCLMFYQAVLFLGYVWADFVASRVNTRRWRLAQLAVVIAPAATFPFHFAQVPLPPIAAVLVALAASVGLAFFALSTTSIVAQRWFAASGHPGHADPQFLYGVSNAGSLLALVAYPLVIEPALGMRSQLAGWYVLYGVFGLLHVASLPAPAATLSAALPHALPARGVRFYWLLLAAAATALLTAVTNVVTVDASMPLLWTVPLAFYLLTLIICFGRRLPSFRTIGWLCAASFAAATVMLPLATVSPGLRQLATVTLNCAIGFSGCLLCHWNLARARPTAPELLGGYYVRLSLGGWLGTALVALGVPAALGFLALDALDYAVAGLLVAAALVLRLRGAITAFLRPARNSPLAWAGLGLVAIVLVALGLSAQSAVQARRYGAHTFYGRYQVTERGGLRLFHHGSTVHGVERTDAARAGEPLAYFHHESPIGKFFEAGLAGPRVGIVGLGIGTLAAYARDGDAWDFYELDPEVEAIARAQFGFLARAHGQVRVVLGDARLTLAGAREGGYSLLVLDAFSSDFVPTHLITREAVALYLSRCAPNGRVAFNVTNRWFDLVPELSRIAASLGATAVWASGPELGAKAREAEADGRFKSRWLVLSMDPAALEPLAPLGFVPVPKLAGADAWTDDKVNLLRALGR